MSLMDDIERLGTATDNGEMDADYAAQALVDLSRQRLTRAGAAHALQNWKTMRTGPAPGWSQSQWITASLKAANLSGAALALPFDEVLERLTAGVDRDVQRAQAAEHPDWDATPEGSVWNSSGWVADVAGDLNQHVANFDPAWVLERYAPAIRDVLHLHTEAEGDSLLSERDAGFEAGVYAALEHLATIYPDQSAETGGQS